MNKIAEYAIVSDTDLSEFANAVNALISKGFQPFGSVSTAYSPKEDGVCASQAMVKYATNMEDQGVEPVVVEP